MKWQNENIKIRNTTLSKKRKKGGRDGREK